MNILSFGLLNFMKLFCAFCLIGLLLGGSIFAATESQNEVDIIIDGEELELIPSPKIKYEVAMVPFRPFYDALDAEVYWDENKERLSAKKGDRRVDLTVGRAVAFVGGTYELLNISPFIHENRVYVPLRFAAESLRANVDYDKSKGSIEIETRPDPFYIPRDRDYDDFREIYDAGDLDKLRKNPEDNFILRDNIDLEGNNFKPIGYAPHECYCPDEVFNGTLVGNGYKIKNLSIEKPGDDYQAMFVGLGEQGKIVDVVLENVDVKGHSFVGGLVGKNNGVIEASYVNGKVEGNGYGIGKIAGINDGKLMYNETSGEIRGNSKVIGGTVGYNSGEIIYARANSDVFGSDKFIGGLAGRNSGIIENSRAGGYVKGEDKFVGGLTGENSGEILLSYASGNVVGASDEGITGGLVGENSGDILNSYASGDVKGNKLTGGLNGKNYGLIQSSHARGDVNGIIDGKEQFGSLAGGLLAQNSGVVKRSFAEGDVKADGEVGGFVGVNYATIEESFSDINKVEGVINSKSTGGFVGGNEGNIFFSYALSKVVGEEQVGGFSGYNKGLIEKSYAASKVIGEDFVGSFSGRNRRGSRRSYDNGIRKEYSGEIVDSFSYDRDNLDFVTRMDLGEEPGSRSVFYSDLKKEETFVKAGWDFTDTWEIREGETFPYITGVGRSLPQRTDLIK